MLQRFRTKTPSTSIFVQIYSVYYLQYAIQAKSSALSTQSNYYSYSNSYTYLFETCTTIRQLFQLRAHMIISGHSQNIYLLPKLVSKYAAYGVMADARQLFDKTHKQNIYLWTAMINGYVRNGLFEDAVLLYHQMNADGISADRFIFSSVIKACANLSALQEGIEIHNDIVRAGFELDTVVGTALVAMYAKCGEIEVAREMFDKMLERNAVTWSAIIAGYALKRKTSEALRLFNEMQMQGIKPDSVIMVSVLPAFTRLSDLRLAECIHGYVIRSGFEFDFVVSSALIDMYCKSGRVGFARQVFEKMPEGNVGSWNAMIAGYTQNGCAEEALLLFNEMQVSGVEPNLITMVSVIPASAHLSALHLGKCIHGYAIRSGFHSDVMIVTALIDMYAKSGSMESSRSLFERMPKRNVVSWNSMIAGYAQNGYASEALTLFSEMQLQGLKPDSVTVVNALPACAHLSALQLGKGIHGYIIQSNLEPDVTVCNALLDMYAKCGMVGCTFQLFDSMSQKTLVSWNTMIGGCGMHGYGKDALAFFTRMQQEGITPDHITFILVLSACSHSGLLDEGWQCFDSMTEDYRITPSMEHYACMVDLLGRSGLLDEAHDFIKRMPTKPNFVVWGSLLGACRVHGNVLLAESAMKHILELLPESVGHYVLLSNIYAETGRRDAAAKLRNMVKVKGLKKAPGCSWIEINSSIHSFFVAEGEGEGYG
ncbi:hypothetical protein SUGI_1200050 [Cryptomeria japonica]|uniref:pentatricopeptide repeat-containing protein At1g11290, chloroplastic-like n=1 Tax=Cryptomeria japonica TaxID=3369 RepID=UPI002414C031|nr:pentatricopeptide repeat-containing protein At1g11290, chloroplastic-like [Cryptomeria japonica]GLJ55895.1 hypothetical protein SUGI_1200050 [Cryptomeria japonica]